MAYESFAHSPHDWNYGCLLDIHNEAYERLNGGGQDHGLRKGQGQKGRR